MNRLQAYLLVTLVFAGQSLVAQEKKGFWKKYGSAIAAGTAALAAAGIAVAAGVSIGDKTKTALEKAKITPNDQGYPQVVALVAFLGPLGENNADKLIDWAGDNQYINEDEYCALAVGKIRVALNHYWGKGLTRSGLSQLKGAAKCGLGADVVGAVKDTLGGLKSAAGKYFKKLW